jgi:hypothetical protein
MTTQALQDHILFQTGYLVNGIWKTLDTTFDVLNPLPAKSSRKSRKRVKHKPKTLLQRPPSLPGMACQNRERALGDSLSLVRTDY